MAENISRQIVLAARPQGRVQLSDFRIEETTSPVPGADQILLAVQYLSLDPYMRGRMDDRKSYAKPVQIGEVMVGESVATVIASNHSAYAVGDTVVAPTGWRTHCLSDGTGLRKLDATLAPVTTALGVLGMPGFTAYSGLHLIGKPSPGETVVVAAASGPVGSLVGQLAKIAGARAVGIAGGPDKCRYVKDELDFDAALESSRARSCREVGRGLSARDRHLFRECRRRDLASRVAAAQWLCPRAGVRADRAIQRNRSSRGA